jgi:predicted nuclease of predicted toxin-antitoxin system
MHFLCDVHISYKIANFLKSEGHEVTHVNSILEKWHTKDKDISSYADDNDLIVFTKDSDFKESYYLKKSPKKLIKVNLGNISNAELIHVLSEVHIKHV